MAYPNIYSICRKHYGKTVRITCLDGRVHSGRITRVTREHVWIRPIGGFGGFGYGFYGGYGYGIPIALAAIGGFALATAFLW
ncbi:hypothetical protein [Domibacillus epiphyticus]|uniref:Uncharacterized protein n=1 Tax=Domibacillus epiphyticus TaxID=1714355 RepID=A0A1V2A5T5_9BACI|nr:hypothetical protein [Domibacillus epiphyticus]OMP66353.1 hypothetical protein BTO28_12900 [Domibacillus epiphyticus]